MDKQDFWVSNDFFVNSKFTIYLSVIFLIICITGILFCCEIFLIET